MNKFVKNEYLRYCEYANICSFCKRNYNCYAFEAALYEIYKSKYNLFFTPSILILIVIRIIIMYFVGLFAETIVYLFEHFFF